MNYVLRYIKIIILTALVIFNLRVANSQQYFNPSPLIHPQQSTWRTIDNGNKNINPYHNSTANQKLTNSPYNDNANSNSDSVVAVAGYPSYQQQGIGGAGQSNRYPPVGENYAGGSAQENWDTSGGGGSNRYIIPNSYSKSISGDYCWDPLFSCDTANTILYCVTGRCTCPTAWTMAPGNLPLNTVWHPSVKRCVSLLGSGCHISGNAAGNGYVFCQPGTRCIRHSQFPEVGICGASSLQIFTYFIPAIFVIFISKYL